jgi:hypothetical protein
MWCDRRLSRALCVIECGMRMPGNYYKEVVVIIIIIIII